MARKEMNVAAIAKAVDARMNQLDLKGVGPTEIARRMGSNPTNVNNLRRAHTLGKKSFQARNLREASRALEWPEDALERVEAGEACPEELPDVPWIDEDADVRQLLDEIVLRLGALQRQAEDRDREVVSLAERVASLERRDGR